MKEIIVPSKNELAIARLLCRLLLQNGYVLKREWMPTLKESKYLRQEVQRLKRDCGVQEYYTDKGYIWSMPAKYQWELAQQKNQAN